MIPERLDDVDKTKLGKEAVKEDKKEIEPGKIQGREIVNLDPKSLDSTMLEEEKKVEVQSSKVLSKNEEPTTTSQTIKEKVIELGEDIKEKFEPITEKLMPSSTSKTEKKLQVRESKELLIDDDSKEAKAYKQALLSIESNDKNKVDPVTLTVLAEALAQKYLKYDNVEIATIVRLEAAQHCTSSSPLKGLQDKAIQHTKRPALRISNIDSGLIQKGSISVQSRTFDGKKSPETLHIEARLTEHARDDLNKSLMQIYSNTDQFLKGLPPGFCTNVRCEIEDDGYLKRNPDKTFSTDLSEGFVLGKRATVYFQGVGKVSIGVSEEYSIIHGLHRRLEVELDPSIPPEQATEKLNFMLASLGLGGMSTSSRQEDKDRMKVLQRFRSSYPNEGYNFEKEPSSYEISVDELKKKIIEEVPEMKDKFNDLDPEKDAMYETKVLEGQKVWCVRGVGDEVQKAGGLGLVHGVKGDDDEAAANYIASKIEACIAGQVQYEEGSIRPGTSIKTDIEVAGKVFFSRLVDKRMLNEPNKMPFFGRMQLLLDRNLVERTDCYAYESDRYGAKKSYKVGDVRVENPYAKRQNLVDFAKRIADPNEKIFYSNEVCFPDGVDTQSIKGVHVKTDQAKATLLKVFQKRGLVYTDNDNVIRMKLNDKPFDEFIYVGKTIDAKVWD